MYCLKVSLRCIHWSPRLHSVKIGINGIGLGRGKGGRKGVHRKGKIRAGRRDTEFFNAGPTASRVSRGSRIFWRLQNISGPGVFRETRDSSWLFPRTFVQKQRCVLRGSCKEGRERRGDRKREKILRGKVRKEEKLLSPWPRMLSDVLFFFPFPGIDRSGIRPLDPQIVRLQLERGELVALARETRSLICYQLTPVRVYFKIHIRK